MKHIFLVYPTPAENPACKCKASPLAAMLCSHGHMLECHHPYSCTAAGCSHLAGYDVSPVEFKQLQLHARERIERGEMPPYKLDEQGNVVVDLVLLHSSEYLAGQVSQSDQTHDRAKG